MPAQLAKAKEEADFHIVFDDGFGYALRNGKVEKRGRSLKVDHIRTIEGLVARLPDGTQAKGFFLTVDLSKEFLFQSWGWSTDHEVILPEGVSLEVYDVRDWKLMHLKLCTTLSSTNGLSSVFFKTEDTERSKGYFVVARIHEAGQDIFLPPKELTAWETSQHAYAKLRFQASETDPLIVEAHMVLV
jgi:hypothetical protein